MSKKVDYSKLPLFILKNFFMLIPFALTIIARYGMVKNEEFPEVAAKWEIAMYVMLGLFIACLIAWLVIQGIKFFKTKEEIESHD